MRFFAPTIKQQNLNVIYICSKRKDTSLIETTSKDEIADLGFINSPGYRRNNFFVWHSRREAVPLYLGGLHLALRSLRRAHPTFPQAHRNQTFPLHGVRSLLLPVRSPVSAPPSPRDDVKVPLNQPMTPPLGLSEFKAPAMFHFVHQRNFKLNLERGMGTFSFSLHGNHQENWESLSAFVFMHGGRILIYILHLISVHALQSWTQFLNKNRKGRRDWNTLGSRDVHASIQSSISPSKRRRMGGGNMEEFCSVFLKKSYDPDVTSVALFFSFFLHIELCLSLEFECQ